MNKVCTKKGFTLIELLIVIGILAILATVTLLVLNPAQMFAQARDSQRISDLNTIKSAIALYTSTVSLPSLDDTSSGTNCAGNLWGTIASTTPFTVAHNVFRGASATTTVGTGGWVPVALGNTSGGSPISALPLDPVGVDAATFSNTNSAYAYFYTCDTARMVFELNGNLESTRYSLGGSDDKESTDGGDRAYMYETGSALDL